MFRKITTEEFDQLTLHGRGRTSPLYNAILGLKIGESLIIDKKGWKAHYVPTQMVTRIERKYGTKYKRGALPDRSGWAVKRIS